MEIYDVIVVGGGAAGMMAAGRAGERGKRVLLLEKNKRLGEKLSITGGGRCNITNAEYNLRTLLSQYGDAEQFLYSAYTTYGVKDTLSFFESKGLPIVVEDLKRAFPKSQRASDVTLVLKKYLHETGVTVKTEHAVKRVLTDEKKIIGVETEKGKFFAEKFIFATGGVSRPETGSTGDGFGWLRKLGHSIAKPDPDIVPLCVREQWVKSLGGVSLQSIRIVFFVDGAHAFAKEGRILFTHFGLSGPLIMNTAREVKKLLEKGIVTATIDVSPRLDHGGLQKRLIAIFDAHKNKNVRNVLSECIPRGLIPVVLSLLPPALATKKTHSVTVGERKLIGHVMKALPMTIEGLMGYDWAVISDGGVPLKEMDMRTMASLIHPNLHIVGDLLHINRPSGGFSLQLCWTSGYIAGESV